MTRISLYLCTLLAFPAAAGPLVSTYSTFVGTATDAFYDEIYGVATDAQGNIYLAGVTSYDLQQPHETGFPRTTGSLLIPHPTASNECAFKCGFVLKLNSRHEVVYGALMSGLRIFALAVDAQQNVYITGRTDVGLQFPWTPSNFDIVAATPPVGAMTPQAFVAKLNNSGSALTYASLFAATEGKGIAVDSSGSAYVVGTVQGPGLPTTTGALKPAYQNAAPGLTNPEGFLLKVNAAGSALDYGTYLGGAGTDEALAVTVTAARHAIVVGSAESADFLPSPASPAGGTDAFVIEVAADGSRIVRSRFLGGTFGDSALTVAHDGTGGFLVAGATNSNDFPFTPGVVQGRLLGARDGWIARLDATFSTRYSSYLGGSDIDGVLSVVGDDVGNAYFAGVSFSADMPTTLDALQDITGRVTHDALAAAGREIYKQSPRGVREAYFGVLSADGRTLRHGSYLSGSFTRPRGYDALTIATAVARSASGRIFVGGSTTAESFPTAGGLRSGMGGLSDAFLTEWQEQAFQISTESLLPGAEVDAGPYSAQLASSGGAAPVQWQVVGFRVIEGLALSADGLISGSARQAYDASGALLNEGGAYQFTVKATDATGAVAHKSFFLPQLHPGSPVCSSGVCRFEGRVGDEPPLYDPPIPNRAQPPLTLLVAGALPPGVSLDANGLFAGRTTTAGRYRVALTVRDSVGASAAIEWDLNIMDPSPEPSPAPVPAPAPAPPAASSGGGGMVDLLSLVMILLLGLNRVFRNH